LARTQRERRVKTGPVVTRSVLRTSSRQAGAPKDGDRGADEEHELKRVDVALRHHVDQEANQP
jgi:hypothetical protein